MAKRKVCVVITARPSYSRIRTALKAIQASPDLELQLVVAASALLDRYGNAVHYIEQDGFKPAAHVHMVLEGENLAAMAKTTGLGMLELSTAIDNLKPDVVVTIADRFETMATAVAAAYMNVPLVHIQGGEVTGSIDEKVRHAITKLSDFHFVSTQKAAERVERMGEGKDRIFVTGCPSIDLAVEVRDRPEMDFCPFEKYGGVGVKADLGRGYVVVLQHPVTTEHTEARAHIDETLEAVHALDMPALWFWPNVDAGADGTSKGIRSFRERVKTSKFHFFKNMTGTDFLRLLVNSKCLVGNSSVGIRECSFLGVPVVNIGTRQEGRERGPNVLDVQPERAAIMDACRAQIQHGRFESDPIYGTGKAGEAIAARLVKIPPLFSKRLTY
jgi:UDP-hydrolysing UDP-N-acetyl-D-glucosamine 2-epimerase